MRDKSGRGNHATAPSDAARPVLRARYNLLTYSEQFDNPAWVKTSATVTSDAAVSPNGTTTADKLIADAALGQHRVNLTPVSPAGVQTFSVYAKASEYSFVFLRIGTIGAGFSLIDGSTFEIAGGVTTTSANVGGGWYRVSVSLTVAANAIVRINVLPTAAFSDFSGDGTSGVFIWGSQLVTETDNASIGGRYQRISTATDYDTAGFFPYLAYDGTNYSMSTSAIDFTGTNKMSVFAGITKLSDAAQAVVAELSATIASNNGSFLLTAPNSAAANYNFSSKGTTQVDNTVTTYTAPITNVVTGLADIGAPSNIIRVNGVQAGSSASSQGTGNFGNYALFIGGRNNANLRLNGRLYGLIVRGAASSAAQVTSTERWLAGETGVTI
jgi:hypothetical protein